MLAWARWIRRQVGSLGRGTRSLLFRLQGGTRYRQRYYRRELAEASRRGLERSDISDHGSTIFFHALAARPRLIVELGTRGGESTRTLLAAAAVAGADVLSIDRDDCSAVDSPHRDRWHFERGDDVEFARDRFRAWCVSRGFPPTAEVIFVDTSHEFEHTRQELAAWLPLLSEQGVMILHDTNMGRGVYARLDGSVDARGWDNKRGVIRAIEELMRASYSENSVFADACGDFALLHYPFCNGLTVLRKLAGLDARR